MLVELMESKNEEIKANKAAARHKFAEIYLKLLK